MTTFVPGEPVTPPDRPIYLIEIGGGEAIRLSAYGVVLAFLALAVAGALLGDTRVDSLWSSGVMIATYLVTIVAHELVHGIFFKLFGGSPQYGVGFSHGLPYAYATSPGDRFAAWRMYVIGAAPLVLVTTAAAAVGLLMPNYAEYAVMAIVANVSGAVGDLWMMTRMYVFTRRAAVTFADTRTGLAVYSDDPRASTIAERLRQRSETALPGRVIAAGVGCATVLLFVTMLVPVLLAAVGTESEVVLGPSWLALVDYRPLSDGLEVRLGFLPAILGGVVFALFYRWVLAKRSAVGDAA